MPVTAMFLKKLHSSLNRTRAKLKEAIRSAAIFIDEDFEAGLTALEETLLSSDVGTNATQEIIHKIREDKKKHSRKRDSVPLIAKILIDLLNTAQVMKSEPVPPYTALAVGINGTGKTTSIAKLAKHYKTRGERVLLVASDTYRAAGVEQLEIWAKRIGVDILKSRMGQDPASVAYDALESAIARAYSVVLFDTAGRLHTNQALIAELQKIKKVLGKKRNDLPQDIFLVLDATTGQNSLAQARIFKDALDVTGVILTKIDGTAKGGIVLAISKELGLPVKYIGTGESMNDLIEFDPALFVSSILETHQVE